ncbi:hypothetical protein DFH29DRAFT_870779 [Suillus ampliporus]|nr:hypothetical protein DFH29DRAFT_870779 [Suillus ampliporus]
MRSTNGDIKEVLQPEDGNFGSLQAATVNYQAYNYQSVERSPLETNLRALKFPTDSNEPSGYPDPNDGAVLRCIDGAEWNAYYNIPSWAHQFHFGSDSHFTLPVDPEALYFLSQGVFQHGTITLEQSPEASDTTRPRCIL